ncbi:MAG: GNAT family N-acetyltransferase [Sphingobacteriales bacterium]|nr:GNAT family N-acetyltransferase [Sphingobacteriales bacterium]MBI3718639.1 GNAT family N-acetyltransferase [Sphingobacteriales bacterium]
MIRAGIEDKNRIVEILSNSFDDNKSINYIIPQDVKRKKWIRKLMAYSFDVCYLSGDVFLSGDKKAFALILLPDKKKISLRSVLLDIKLATSVIGLRNVKKAMSREASISKIHPEGFLYYLWFIGVDCSEQGKGIGSKLLTAVIEEGLSQKRIICLETSTLKNLPWYEKHRFKTYKELDFGYSLYCMKRT